MKSNDGQLANVAVFCHTVVAVVNVQWAKCGRGGMHCTQTEIGLWCICGLTLAARPVKGYVVACMANWPVRHDLRGSTIRQAHMTESFQPTRHSRLSSTAQPCQDSGFVYRWESCTTNARGGEDSRVGLLLIAPSDPSFRCLDCSGPSVTGGWCRGVQPLALLLSSHPLTDPPVHGVPKRSDCDGIRTGLSLPGAA